jgi:hypothetical protein
MDNPIKKYLEKHNMPAYKLAEIVGLATSTVCRQAYYDKPIGEEAAIKYHLRLGIPLEDLGYKQNLYCHEDQREGERRSGKEPRSGKERRKG